MALLLVAALAVGGWWLLEGRYTRTPAVVGLSKAAAATKLQTAGLDVSARTAFSDTVPKGEVISSDPGRAEKVLDGGTVTITVSRGVEQYSLPRLAGKSLEAASNALDEIKMKLGGPVERWSETVPEGHVIRTDPKAGTVLRPGHTVRVVVSKGRQPITVGDWEGRSATLAERALERHHLQVDLDEDYDDDVAKGHVINQSPDPGTTLHRGDTVSLLVSKGPHLVDVPNVTGKGIEDARKELEDKGFSVEVDHFSPYFGLGYVMEQDPSGDKVPYGSSITLYVS